MSYIFRLLSSPRLALILLCGFAIAMGSATFIENDYGTPVAWQLVYNSIWFEALMAGLGLCFIANIFKYKLWRPAKWSLLLFHIAFIIILLGAAITRYTAESGIIRIREGHQSSTMISDKTLLSIKVSDGKKQWTEQLRLPLHQPGLPKFSHQVKLPDQTLTLSEISLIPDAGIQVINDTLKGQPILETVVSRGNGRETLLLEKNESVFLGDLALALTNLPDQDAGKQIGIWKEQDQFYLKSPVPLDYFVMSEQRAGSVPADTLWPISMRTLFRKGDFSFVPLAYYDQASIQLHSEAETPGKNDENRDDAIRLKISAGEVTQEAYLLYREGFLPLEETFSLGNYTITLSYGSVPIALPFSIYLNDFQLERYPGSTSPSAYASEVTIMDGSKKMPYRIFMNNVLDYQGYRFYQASYDTDEQGTVLAVNQDRAGTLVSYLGYLLMGTGMFFTLFGRNSHFRRVNQNLKKLRKKSQITVLWALMCFSVQLLGAQGPALPDLRPDATQAGSFGKLLVQDLDGRIKPLNSLASEFLRKISGKTSLSIPRPQGTDAVYNADQFFLSLHMYPGHWRNVPLIRMDTRKLTQDLKKQFPEDRELFSFSDFLAPDGSYLLGEAAEKANLKKPALRNETDQEILKADERFNILFNLYQGTYLKIFPKKNDPDHTWYGPGHHFRDFPAEDAAFARQILNLYFSDLDAGNAEGAREKLEYIATYQHVLASDIIPDQRKVEAEIWYNRLRINFWMFQFLFTIGLILLVLAIWHIIKPNRYIHLIKNLSTALLFAGFLIFTANLILRWYIAGHAPWSNGYEMLVFVSWVLWLCGFLAYKKSDFVLPLVTLFSGSLLLVSYLDWLNPEITNLMPVLKSYWLKVHVATIVSSYAPLALSAICAMTALILIIIKGMAGMERLEVNIRELTYINEISMTIGLFVLAVGTFLGGIWANESWGRYWAWDPKETWALISIIIYAIVLHLRMVPGLYNTFVLNMASMFAFWSIIMTSFGVNYYLSGLHSYAAGDPMPIPDFVYILMCSMVVISILAWRQHRRLLSQGLSSGNARNDGPDTN